MENTKENLNDLKLSKEAEELINNLIKITALIMTIETINELKEKEGEKQNERN